MKVYSCTNNTVKDKKEPEFLTWEEIKEKEGVYKVTNSFNIMEDVRFIVLSKMGTVSVLYYNSKSAMLEPAAHELWTREKFCRVDDAAVLFEIKEN